MGAVTFRYYNVFTIPTSSAMTPGSPHGAAGQHTRQPPPVPPAGSVSTPLRDDIWPLTSCWLIRRCHMGAFTFRHYYVFTIPTSTTMTLASPHSAARQQQQPPSPQTQKRRYHMGAVTFHYYYVLTIPTSPAVTPVSPHGAAGQQIQFEALDHRFPA